MPSRRDQINLLLRQLESHRAAAMSVGQTYALEANIELVESLASPAAYARWLADRLPQLRPDGLLELNELLPEWDGPIHSKLLQIERYHWRGFIRPLVDHLTHEITSAGRPLVIIDVGAGAMEVERQVLARLRDRSDVEPCTWIAIDESPIAQQHARNNLAELATGVTVTSASLSDAVELSRAASNRHRVILCHARALEINALTSKRCDLLFHSFLRHHLSELDRQSLDVAAARVAHTTVEYDGHRSMAHLIPLSILTWRHPAFLAAALFSHARFPTRADLRQRDPGALRFFPNGCYLAQR